jgi:segregation and condensation protein B
MSEKKRKAKRVADDQVPTAEQPADENVQSAADGEAASGFVEDAEGAQPVAGEPVRGPEGESGGLVPSEPLDDLDGESRDDQPAADVSVGEMTAEELAAAVLDSPVAEPVVEVKAGKVSEELKSIIEALIYASPDPLTPKTLFKVLESEPREDVQVSLDALRRDYAEGQGGLHLVEVAGGYQIMTRPELSEWVRRLFHERKTQKLSVAALETLAVIAYKQPITAPEITDIRGVNTGGVIATLLERRLVKIAGRKQVVGRPFLYATTREFLIRFGLRDLNDLPKMEDMADVLGFEPPSGLAEAGPSETPLPLDTTPDPDKTMDVGSQPSPMARLQE